MPRRRGAPKTSAFYKPVQPDAKLAALIGSKPRPRTQITKDIWKYIKKNHLQSKQDGRYIVPKTEAMRKFMGTSRQIHMTKIPGLISKHVS